VTIRVLNLEDVDSDSELVRHELKRAGLDFTLTRVDGRADFEAALRDGPPDVVISDHNVPQFDGRAALDILRARSPETPFILFTGSLNEEAAVAYMKAGAADYILKDRIARLGPAVREAMQRASERRALRAYEELLRQIVDADPSLISVKDADGRYVLINRALAEALRTTPAAAVGQRDADLAAGFLPALPPGAHDATVLRTGRTVVVPQVTVADATGVERYFQLIKVPLRLPGDPDVKVLSVATDITQHKQLEEQLRQAQKLEAIGQLAGGVAHDFNNILTAILGTADLLLADMPPADPKREDAEEIRLAARRAAGLTRQLLAFSRKGTTERQPFDLNDLVRGLEAMLRRLLAANIDIRFALASGLSAVLADPGQIEQVLLNLAVNARDAMPRGGKLTIETADAELDATYAAAHQGVSPGRYVMLAVSDTGVGMDPVTQARIFQPFFTTKEPGKGTGLGLSTVDAIVRQHRGHVWLYSEPGKGTVFKVYLPLATEAAAPAEAAAPVAPLRGRETVLVVEDTQAVRALVARVLEGLGYTVLEAADASMAEVVAARHPGVIDLLLTDVVMPGDSGPELARRLAGTRPGMRVLYTSGYADEAVVHHGVVAAGAAYLQKPFTPDALARKARDVLDQG
jgi:hypothetical protein